MVNQMLKVEVILGQNDVMAISEELKKIGIGGLTVSKVRGRGKKPGPEIHASKGSEIFVSQILRAVDIATGTEGEDTI